MIIALLAIVVVALVVWAIASFAVNAGDQTIASGAPSDVKFPSPTDVWNSVSPPVSVTSASSAASAGIKSAWNSASTSSNPLPPPGAAGTPAPPAPAGGIFSFIPGWNQTTGTNVSTSVTAVPGAPEIVEGQAYRCSSIPDAVFRGFNNTIRMYPSPTIAASWDRRWGDAKTIDCSKVERGPAMEMNPDPKMIEGHSYTCAEGGVYRAMNGVLRWYPNRAIAASWDPAWASPVKIDCSGVKKGHPMEMAPSPALPSAATSEPAPVKSVENPNAGRIKEIEKRLGEVDADLKYLHGLGLTAAGNATTRDREMEKKRLIEENSKLRGR